jgi:hypothetical protein
LLGTNVRRPKMTGRLPDFLIIGAMKCATTSLHEQLARQPHIFMSHPKEPNFFSDDENYALGLDRYRSLFREAPEDALCGESSTHYTKLPTFPHTVDRMAAALARVKLIYVMRHPVDRLISQYVHELTTGRITSGIHEAIDRYPELVDYGRYSIQLKPYLNAFGPESVLPVFFGRLARHPQDELERICRFLGYPGKPRWDHAMKPQNVGSERLRRSAIREVLVQAPALTMVRRLLIPRSWTESIKALWRARIDPPRPSSALVERLRAIYDDDLTQLGQWLGVHLDCENFTEVTLEHACSWAEIGQHVLD